MVIHRYSISFETLFTLFLAQLSRASRANARALLSKGRTSNIANLRRTAPGIVLSRYVQRRG
jgi:hypothetical protein